MRLQETAKNGEKYKKSNPTCGKKTREDGAGICERENSFLFQKFLKNLFYYNISGQKSCNIT